MTPKLPSNSGQWLLAGLRLSNPQSAADDASRLGRLTPAEWEAVVHLALAHGVAPLLYQRLTAPAAGGQAPAVVVEELRKIYAATTAKNGLLYRQLAEVLRALTGAGIAVITLKGAHLAERVYASRALRPMGDIDLLVAKADLEKVNSVLQASGYRYKGSSDFDFAVDQHWPSLVRPGGKPVEAHWTIAPPASSARIDVAGLWQRAQPEKIAGESTLVLCPEDLLLYVCLHAAIHHRFTGGLRPLVDVAEVAGRLGRQLDWAVVSSRAREWQVARAVHLTLQMAHDLLSADIPASALREMQPPGFDRQLVVAAQDKMFRRSADLSSNFMQLWRPAGARAKLGLFFASLFPPRTVMAGLYPIGTSPLRLGYYYLVRLKDLLARYGRAALRRWLGDKAAVSQIVSDTALRGRDEALRDWLASG